MRAWDRLLLAVSSLLTGMLSILALGFGTELLPLSWLDTFFVGIQQVDWLFRLYMIIALFMLLGAVRLYWISLPPRQVEPKSISKQTTLGEIFISTLTIEHLALRAAQSIQGLQEPQTKVKIKPEGIQIEVRGMVDGEHNIPWMSEELQKKVKLEVETITGVAIPAIEVRIDDLIATARNKRPAEMR